MTGIITGITNRRRSDTKHLASHVLLEGENRNDSTMSAKITSIASLFTMTLSGSAI